jgi:THO complex subunit 2
VLKSDLAQGPWIPDLAARFSDLKSLAPDAWEGMTYVIVVASGNVLAETLISPGFYMTFWQMSMYDLSPPKNCYETELTRLRRMVDALSVKNPTDEQTRISRRLTNIMAALTRESTAQQKTYQFTKRRLAREKAHWFVKGT